MIPSQWRFLPFDCFARVGAAEVFTLVSGDQAHVEKVLSPCGPFFVSAIPPLREYRSHVESVSVKIRAVYRDLWRAPPGADSVALALHLHVQVPRARPRSAVQRPCGSVHTLRLSLLTTRDKPWPEVRWTGWPWAAGRAGPCLAAPLWIPG